MQTCKRCLTMFNYSAFSTVCSGMLCGADGQEGWWVVCMSSVMHNVRMWPWCSAYHHNLSMGICQATMHTIMIVHTIIWVYVRPPLPSPSPLHLPGRCWLLHGCRLHAQECCTGGSTLGVLYVVSLISGTVPDIIHKWVIMRYRMSTAPKMVCVQV